MVKKSKKSIKEKELKKVSGGWVAAAPKAEIDYPLSGQEPKGLPGKQILPL